MKPIDVVATDVVYGYIAGRPFCDEQARDPFAVWRHMHLFEPIGPSQTLYQDRIEFAVARFPNRFQRRCVGDVRASYTRRPDGRLDVVNRCRTADGQTEARGVARIVDQQTFARLKVRFAPAWLSFLPPVWGDYWIIGLAPDYSWAVVGDPGSDYLWILARAPRLDEESIAAARAAARASGYDVERLVQTSHPGAGRP